jgi:hypothetical protein
VQVFNCHSFRTTTYISTRWHRSFSQQCDPPDPLISFSNDLKARLYHTPSYALHRSWPKPSELRELHSTLQPAQLNHEYTLPPSPENLFNAPTERHRASSQPPVPKMSNPQSTKSNRATTLAYVNPPHPTPINLIPLSPSPSPGKPPPSSSSPAPA